MRLHKKFYRVMFGATRFVRDFYDLEEACEYAEMLAMETKKDVVVWQVDPDALRKIDAFVPILFYSVRLGNGIDVPVLRVWYDVCYIPSMRQAKKLYRVMIELTGFAKDFDCIEEARKCAEKLARDTGFEVVVWEVEPSAHSALEMYVPIFFYEGAYDEDQNGTDVA